MSNLYRIKKGVYAKTPQIRSDWQTQLTPQLRVLLMAFEDEMAAAGDVVYTSILRPADTDSVHAYGRGADVRLYHPDRELELGSVGAGLPIDGPAAAWVHDALERLTLAFGPWKGGDGNEHDCFVIHGKGLDKHIHIQVPGRAWQ